MWKTKLGKCIYVSESGYKVFQNPAYRWLTLGSAALQSVLNRWQPHKPILRYLPALSLMARHKPENCCILGLGGGAIAHLLAFKTPEQQLTIIENSQEVIDLAKKFFWIDKIANLTIINQNAESFVKAEGPSFTHLIVDLYNASSFPAECNTADFFLNCKRKIADGGFFAVNLANLMEQGPIFQLIKKYFKNTLVLPVKHTANMVIIASDHSEPDVFISELNKTEEIKKIMLVANWGNVGQLGG
ncbi:MAG: fused MFS/spermidine synthase [Legionella sp.]|nr:fused MFS/spermidine synthase [Legionella sp.]